MELRGGPNGGQVRAAVGGGAACAVGTTEDLAADGDAARGAEEALALRLCALTSEFYRANAESFSQTRQSPWQGWVRLLEVVDARAAEREPLRVFDLACGNLRFERYLADALPDGMLLGYAVDNCEPLVEAGERKEFGPLSRMAFQNLDVVERLSDGRLREALEAPDVSCDLAVSFGFMHHVPLERWRAELLRALIAKARPGGFVAVSFWRFLNSDKLARKAQETTSRALDELGLPELPPNDYLLGWQDTQGLYRYCHHFDEPEIERLLAAVADSAELVSRFEADGKTGNLNEYVVLRVK